MVQLPENKPTVFDKTPRVFFVWGESMSGKTYFARQFPDPIILNTDGNADKIDTPSIKIKDFRHFAEVLDAIDKGNHTFKTIVIDLIDDIELMIKNYVIDSTNEMLSKQNKPKINVIGDIPFGMGYDKVNSSWKNIMMSISKMPYYVIFISHILEKTENNISVSFPSLPQKALNVCLGRCDLQIQTKKVGNTYLKLTTNKRDNYISTDIKNPKIAKALEGTVGLFDKVNNNIKGDIK